jgi:primosomal protein N' (replication factor Y)
MKIVTIIPLSKGYFPDNLTYFTTKDVAVGSIVLASVRSKKILGLVVLVEDASETKGQIKDMNFNLRKILEVKDRSIFTEEFLKSALYTSKYFAMSDSSTFGYLIPQVLRENYDKIAEYKKETKIENKNDESKLRSEKLLFQTSFNERLSSYKTLIRGSFAEKKSVFMVLPTENDVKKFGTVLARGIENFTFLLHSGLSPKKSLSTIEKVIKTDHPILILATAPFLSLPREDVGTIIIEQEASNAYRTVTNPHFDLRTFVEIYASIAGAKLIFSDSLLRFETIARKELDGLHPAHPLSFRTSFEGELKIAPKGEKFEVLTEENLKEIKNAVEKKKNVFIFALRKGLSTMTVCKDCKSILGCPNCDSPLVLYLSRDGKKRMFICNRCRQDIRPEITCAHCSGWNLMPLGIGTDTVYETIKNIFPKTKTFQLDKENAKTAKGALRIAKEFEENPGSILIGTEMALFYIQEKVPLSIIASFESLWNIPNFKIGEKIVNILLSILEITKDKLIIQTKQENDPAIQAVKKENLLSFIREELTDREKLHYPPYKRFIKITHMGTKEEAQKTKTDLALLLKDYNPEIFSGFVGKVKGEYITNCLIKLETKNWSLPELHQGSSIDEKLLAKLRLLPQEFTVFVDPEDLL